MMSNRYHNWILSFCFLFFCCCCCEDVDQLPNVRPLPNERSFQSPIIDKVIDTLQPLFLNKDTGMLFSNCFPNTLDTTVFSFTTSPKLDTFIITGDIHALWLRDSSNQVMPYIPYATHDINLQMLIEGLIERQAKSILIDSFANAFNFNNDTILFSHDDSSSSIHQHQHDIRIPPMTPAIFEGKYEIDSLCSFLKLCYWHYYYSGDDALYRFTANNDDSSGGSTWLNAVGKVLLTFHAMQQDIDHTTHKMSSSSSSSSSSLSQQQQQQLHMHPMKYRFQRLTTEALDTLIRGGRGVPGRPNGLSRSYFRPSDDAVTFPYNIPGNAMAYAELKHLMVLLRQLIKLNTNSMKQYSRYSSISGGISNDGTNSSSSSSSHSSSHSSNSSNSSSSSSSDSSDSISDSSSSSSSSSSSIIEKESMMRVIDRITAMNKKCQELLLLTQSIKSDIHHALQFYKTRTLSSSSSSLSSSSSSSSLSSSSSSSSSFTFMTRATSKRDPPSTEEGKNDDDDDEILSNERPKHHQHQQQQQQVITIPYEVDGYGNELYMDDANIPSLLSLPLLDTGDFITLYDEVYQRTREFILSKSNVYFYEGEMGEGVGSPHTTDTNNSSRSSSSSGSRSISSYSSSSGRSGRSTSSNNDSDDQDMKSSSDMSDEHNNSDLTNEHIINSNDDKEYIWPMSIIIRALTSQNDEEIATCLHQLVTSSAGTGLLHESFNSQDVKDYTRKHFAWVNGLYAELILYLILVKPRLVLITSDPESVIFAQSLVQPPVVLNTLKT